MPMNTQRHLRRLRQIWVGPPLFFVTTCSFNRRRDLATRHFHEICRKVWQNCEEFYDWYVGRYTIMPDHAHFFCFPRSEEHSLHTFIGKWKEWTAKYAHRRFSVEVPLRQPEFFDHLLRSEDSYREK
jgi:REP-associated tyrosine transposase